MEFIIWICDKSTIFCILGLAETGFFDARGIELLNSAGDINGAVLVSLLFMVGFSILWLTTLRDVKKDERLPVFFTVGVLILEALIIFGVFTDRSFRDSWGWIGIIINVIICILGSCILQCREQRRKRTYVT